MNEVFSGPPAGAAGQDEAHDSDVPDAAEDVRGGPSRRTVMLSGLLAVLVGAGGGVAAAFARPRHAVPRRSKPPAALTDALAAEHRLLGYAARLEPADPALAAQLRTDHAAHARALEAVIGEATGRVPGPSSSAASGPAHAPMARAQLRAEEASAADRAAAAARSLHGAPAALLASIAACEAAHAELLT